MTKTIGFALLALTLLAPTTALAKDATTKLTVTGWHCGGCSKKTEAALKEVKGVKSATANTDANTVTVAYDDSQTNVSALKDAVAKLGYEAKADGAKGGAATKEDATKSDAAKGDTTKGDATKPEQPAKKK